jgi:hypothetical protein
MDGITYIAACDPSGGRADSFTAAIAHQAPDGNVILDAIVEHRPPLNPADAVAEIVKLMRSYHCDRVTGDHYAGNWVVDSFAKHDVRYIQSDRDRSACYLDALPLFSSGRVRLLDNGKLITQFANLERRVFPTGRDRIDHPQGGHDDLANSCAMSLSLAAARPRVQQMPIVAPYIAENPNPLPAHFRAGPNPFIERVESNPLIRVADHPPPAARSREWGG